MSDTAYRCTRCQQVKPADEFAPCRRPPTDQSIWCRTCCNSAHTAWRHKTKPPLQTRECASCTREFLPKREAHVTCSPKCREDHRTRARYGLSWVITHGRVPELIDAAYLATCRYGRRETARAIAERLECAQSAVVSAMKRYGITSRWISECGYCGQPFEAATVKKVYCDDACQARARLVRQYGIDPRQYHDLLEQQGGVCAICGDSPDVASGRFKFLVVDHCHTTGQVRGLLCTRCNTGIGHFQDDPIRIRRAISYVQENR